MSDEGTCNNSSEESSEEWIIYGGFLVLIFAIGVTFWGLGVVVEEYFVPALNLLCDDMKLADDVAGATIMAVGNSSPELFSCLLSLYVTKTTLGVGTAIGSAVFNHLCICAGSILYAENGMLDLDWRILSRECFFYLTSIILLVWCLKGDAFAAGFAEAFEVTSGTVPCLKVTWYQAFVMFLGYCAYVIVCSNYGLVLSLICPQAKLDMAVYEAVQQNDQSGGDVEEVIVLANFANSVNINEVYEDDVENSTIGGCSPTEDELPSEFIELPHNRMSSFYGAVIPPSHPDARPESREQRTLSFASQPRENRTNSVQSKGDSVEAGASSPEHSAMGGGTPAKGEIVSDDVIVRRESASNLTGLPRRESASKFVAYIPMPISRADTGLKSPIIATGIELTNSGQARAVSTLNDDGDNNQMLTVSRAPTFANYVPYHPASGYGGGEPDVIVLPHRASTAGSILISDLPTSKHDFSAVENLTFQCWLYKRRRTYHAFRQMTNQVWQLRNFVFDQNGFRYSDKKIVPGKTDPADVKSFFNVFDITDVAISSIPAREVVMMVKGAKYRVRCINEAEFHLVFETLKEHVKRMNKLSAEEREHLVADANERLATVANGLQAGHHGEHHLMQAPGKDQPVKMVIHYGLYPVKWMLYHTIPEISPSEEREENSKDYWSTIGMSVLWLAILCYIMNDCLERMGTLLGISANAMGLTFGAAGTSIPNLLSSMIVARQGLGNMAISNAFGSNIFCLYFVLGFSWTVYIWTSGSPYDGLKDSGIVLLVIIVLVILVAFLVLVVASKFILRTWMAYLFLLVYVGFLVFAFTL